MAFLDGKKFVTSTRGDKSPNVKSEAGGKEKEEKEGSLGLEDAFSYPQLKLPKGEKQGSNYTARRYADARSARAR